MTQDDKKFEVCPFIHDAGNPLGIACNGGYPFNLHAPLSFTAPRKCAAWDEDACRCRCMS